MHVLFEKITCRLLKFHLIFTAFFWNSCESRHILGIGTRLEVSSDGDWFHSYSTKIRTTEGLQGYSDTDNDYFLQEKPIIPTTLWIFIILVLFTIMALCLYFCVFYKRRWRCLWSNINPNRTDPRSQASPQANNLTPAGANDAPPDYTVVVDQKIMAANNNDGLNDSSKVTENKRPETPPPAYITVAPFK